MDKDTLVRASVDVATEGRTLLGLAIPFETPAEVSDFGGPRYWEAFSRSAFDETLRRNPEPRPLFKSHGWLRGDDPIGVVQFAPAEPGLAFRAFVSRTRDGDEALTLVNDGALKSVSITARALPGKSRRVPLAGKPDVVLRTEVALREMSVAPTGFGQYPDARILAVRDFTFSETQQAVGAAIEASAFGDDRKPGQYVYVRDIADDWVVYVVEDSADEDAAGLFRVSYVLADDDTVTLGEPERVKVSYEPVTPARADVTRSETPNLDKLRSYRRRRGF